LLRTWSGESGVGREPRTPQNVTFMLVLPSGFQKAFVDAPIEPVFYLFSRVDGPPAHARAVLRVGPPFLLRGDTGTPERKAAALQGTGVIPRASAVFPQDAIQVGLLPEADSARKAEVDCSAAPVQELCIRQGRRPGKEIEVSGGKEHVPGGVTAALRAACAFEPKA